MSDHPGLDLLEIEMGRQCADALKTMDTAAAAARQIADSIRRTGRLILYAMGGSQHVNRIVEPLYRAAGIDTRSMIAAEQLLSPLPDGRRTAIFASQSGESGEIKALLATPPGGEERFGLTLEPDSTLARNAIASIVAEGGTEHAFAATRSITLTIAMHAAVLEALEQPQQALRAMLAEPVIGDYSKADAALADCDVYVFAGRHVMQGAAESGALSMMELARVPTIGFEGGQFRHGPFEMLRQKLGILVLRSAGPDRASATDLIETPVRAGCTVVLFDTSGEAAVEGCTHIPLPRSEGLAAVLTTLLTLQQLNICIAKRRIAQGISTPRFTTKVTA